MPCAFSAVRCLLGSPPASFGRFIEAEVTSLSAGRPLLGQKSDSQGKLELINSKCLHHSARIRWPLDLRRLIRASILQRAPRANRHTYLPRLIRLRIDKVRPRWDCGRYGGCAYCFRSHRLAFSVIDSSGLADRGAFKMRIESGNVRRKGDTFLKRFSSSSGEETYGCIVLCRV